MATGCVWLRCTRLLCPQWWSRVAACALLSVCAGFLNEILEVSIVHYPLPDLDFAVYVSDQPQLQLRDYPPGRAPLVMEYSKVCVFRSRPVQCPSG